MGAERAYIREDIRKLRNMQSTYGHLFQHLLREHRDEYPRGNEIATQYREVVREIALREEDDRKTGTTEMKDYIIELLRIVDRMQQDYPSKRFTLDGRLVGDIGEILVEQLYDLELLKGQQPTHDAKSKGRLIQIKTTMKNSLTFGDIPDYYLGIKVGGDGSVEEIFNGPGAIIWEAIKHRKRPKNFLYSIALATLRNLNAHVQEEDRIIRRVG